jgi:hypothetical protein
MIPSILKSAGIMVASLGLAIYFFRRLLALYHQAAGGSRPSWMNLSKAAHAILYSATLIVALFILTGGVMSLVGGLTYNLKGRPLAAVLHAINPKAY